MSDRGFSTGDPVGRRSPKHRHGTSPAAPRSLADAALTLTVAGLLAALSLPVLRLTFDLSPAFVWRAGALLAVTGAAILWAVAIRLRPAPFGAANRITSVRALGVALTAAFVGESARAHVAWFVIALAIAILILDGVDGRLARGRSQASAFGARFDMETDAALTLVLAVLCWQFGKAGAWILGAGLMRYAFVGAAWFAPWVGRRLPLSRRRQTICVLQISGLLAVLSPLFPVPFSSATGAVTLLLLTASFAIDVAWLARQRLRYG